MRVRLELACSIPRPPDQREGGGHAEVSKLPARRRREGRLRQRQDGADSQCTAYRSPPHCDDVPAAWPGLSRVAENRAGRGTPWSAARLRLEPRSDNSLARRPSEARPCSNSHQPSGSPVVVPRPCRWQVARTFRQLCHPLVALVHRHSRSAGGWLGHRVRLWLLVLESRKPRVGRSSPPYSLAAGVGEVAIVVFCP